MLPPDERRDISKITFKMTVDSADGDKVRINLPMALVKIFTESGAGMPDINGKDTLKNIDWNQVLMLVEQGVVGEIMSVDSADGDRVRIVVE